MPEVYDVAFVQALEYIGGLHITRTECLLAVDAANPKWCLFAVDAASSKATDSFPKGLSEATDSYSGLEYDHKFWPTES